MRLSAQQGANRYVWDMRYPGGLRLPGDRIEERPFQGPLAPPGEYQVRLEVGGEAYTQRFRILRDPRITATDADIREQFEMLIELRDKLTESQREVLRSRAVRDQADQWVRRAEGHPGYERLSEAAADLKEKLLAVEGELVDRPDRTWAGAEEQGQPVRQEAERPPRRPDRHSGYLVLGPAQAVLRRLRPALRGDRRAANAAERDYGH